MGRPCLSRDWDPFSRPQHIDRELPAETITELKFLASRVPAVEPAGKSDPRPPKLVVRRGRRACARPKLTGKHGSLSPISEGPELGLHARDLTERGGAFQRKQDCVRLRQAVVGRKLHKAAARPQRLAQEAETFPLNRRRIFQRTYFDAQKCVGVRRRSARPYAKTRDTMRALEGAHVVAIKSG